MTTQLQLINIIIIIIIIIILGMEKKTDPMRSAELARNFALMSSTTFKFWSLSH